MDNKAEALMNKALDAMESAHSKIQDLVEHIEGNDFGSTGIELIKFVNDRVSSDMVKAYSTLEDLYAYVEDLELAP